jgi:hypothetical protein
MSLFGKVVKLAVNVAALPVAVVQDVVTLGGVSREIPKSFVVERIQKLVKDAD